MKKFFILPSLLLVTSLFALQATNTATELAADSAELKTLFLEEVIIVTNPKSQSTLFETPGSISVLSARTIEQNQIESVKDITSLAPNIFIPDYGSKLTTAIYIRGIGTRTNNSVVGMYVDNVPYLDKSIFDFDFLDIERLEVMRGPQSTLYGRNTMAGLINIYTKSPFDYQHTKVSVSYGNYNSLRAYLSRFGKINEKLAYSLSAQYQGSDGYFKNIATGERADSLRSTNGRIQFFWKPTDRTSVNFTSNAEYSTQAGYPYGVIDAETGKLGPVNYNDPGAYNRIMSANSVFTETRFNNLTLTNSVGHQFFKDDMKIDQDFTEKSLFTLNQKQNQQSISYESVLKSNTKSNFQWLTGVFGFWQSFHTNAPVSFKKDGIDEFVNTNIANNIPPIPAGPGSTIILYDSLINNSMVIDGVFSTPTWGTAAFAQLSYNNLFNLEGLSVSAGLRLDYEQARMNHNSSTTAFARGGVLMQTPAMLTPLAIFNDTIQLGISGKEKMDNLEFLPRFDIRYTPNGRCMIYSSVSKGYRAGGYNFQMFSDAIREQLQSSMIGAFIAQAEKIGMGNRIPDNVHDMAKLPDLNIEEMITYKPEYSWNYELGIRSEVLDRSLMFDFSAFYIDVHNRQISAFSENGLGRVTKNTGKSYSYGLETAVKYFPIPSLALSANYGWTRAKFSEYNDGKSDYSNNYVPFAPEHTFSAGANYLLMLNKKWIDHLNFNANFAGVGRIYWTEANDQYQNFYGSLNARITARKGCMEFGMWGKNLTNTQYQAFYFESLGNRLAQRGAPLTFGGEISIRF